MKNLNRYYILAFLLIFLSSCASPKKSGYVPLSTYPSNNKLNLIIDPPIINKENNATDTSSLLKSIEKLYKINDKKGFLHINGKDYANRFDSIMIKKDTHKNIKKLQDMLNTMYYHKNGDSFSYNAVVASDIDKDEPVEDSIKIGFEIFDKPFPYIRGYRSVKESGKRRYTEFYVLQNKNGDSKKQSDVLKLLKFFILMPIHRYRYLTAKKTSIKVLAKEANNFHLKIYTLNMDNIYKSFEQSTLDSDYKLLKELNILQNKNYTKYCSIFDMTTNSKNSFFKKLPLFLDTKARFISLLDNLYSNNVSKCEEKIKYNILDIPINYNDKEALYHTVANNYLKDKISLKISPILDMTIDNNRVYFTMLNGEFGMYNLTNNIIIHKKISDKPLYTITSSNDNIFIGDGNGIIYFVNKRMLKDIKYLKFFPQKIIGMKKISDNKLIVSSIEQMKSLNLKNFISRKLSTDDLLIKIIEPYKGGFVTASNDIKIWDNKNKFKILKSFSSPVKSLSVKKDSILFAVGNSIKKYSLKKPYNSIIDFKILLEKDFIFSATACEGLYMATTKNGKIYIMDKDGKILKKFDIKDKINKTICRNGYLYVATNSGNIYIYDIKLFKLLN